jgi:hypothetical protein
MRYIHLLRGHITEIIIAAAIFVVIVAIVALIVLRRRPRKLKTDYFQEKWRALQKLCASKTTWPQAVTEADGLLDEALRKKRYKGRTMGERLTKAQRTMTNNETVWFGHKLRSKLEHDPEVKLKESDVKQALIGIRQALKDLGAFPDDK